MSHDCTIHIECPSLTNFMFNSCLIHIYKRPADQDKPKILTYQGYVYFEFPKIDDFPLSLKMMLVLNRNTN